MNSNKELYRSMEITIDLINGHLKTIIDGLEGIDKIIKELKTKK